MTPPIRLIAIDIDGTLLDPQFQISVANLKALQRARQAGVEILLVTGRRHTFAMPVAEMLGFDLWLISSNGAITKSTQGEVFHRDLLPAATVRKLLARMEPFRGNAVLTFDIETRGALVVERTDDLNASIGRWMEKNSPYIARVIPMEDALTTDPVQIMFCGSVGRMKLAQEALERAGMGGEMAVLKTEYLARDLCIIDVLNRDCSKGHAVERWARYRNIPRSQVMAIGDNYNDIEMLDFAALPVIMGNACEELKQAGYQLTLANDQSGVAAAIEQALGLSVAAESQSNL